MTAVEKVKWRCVKCGKTTEGYNPGWHDVTHAVDFGLPGDQILEVNGLKVSKRLYQNSKVIGVIVKCGPFKAAYTIEPPNQFHTVWVDGYYGKPQNEPHYIKIGSAGLLRKGIDNLPVTTGSTVNTIGTAVNQILKGTKP